MNSQFVIEVDNLEKTYKGNKVLDKVSFKVKKGEIFALLGSNGAGKTTTIKILSTLLQMDNGSASVCNYDVKTKGDKIREKISLTGQNASVDNLLTGLENMMLIGKLRHLDNIKEQSIDLLKKFELEDAMNRSVSTYSGGMTRRLDLAMSLLANTPVIFLDEPTTGLDPQARMMMWNVIKELTKNGTTVLLTTQYLEEAEQLADQVAILNNGKIVISGSATELKNSIVQSRIILEFYNLNDLHKAKQLLSENECFEDEINLSIIINTDGSVSHLTEILKTIEQNSIELSKLSQKQANLEDVFMSIVTDKDGSDYANNL